MPNGTSVKRGDSDHRPEMLLIQIIKLIIKNCKYQLLLVLKISEKTLTRLTLVVIT
jgi:hypothetical protein